MHQLSAAKARSVGCSDHQANPHVHLSVKASSMLGERLSPRKADLHRRRETFAEKLRGCGIEAEASRPATRGVTRNADALWRLNAGSEGRLQTRKKGDKSGRPAMLSRSEAIKTWGRLADALASSDLADHHRLAAEIHSFIQRRPVVQEALKQRQRQQTLEQTQQQARRQTQQPAPDAKQPYRGKAGRGLTWSADGAARPRQHPGGRTVRPLSCQSGVQTPAPVPLGQGLLRIGIELRIPRLRVRHDPSWLRAQHHVRH